ncbi:hypothetical protein [Paenibacillus piri]|uniref:Uncharacterized protein n=1 Tax=Paenibacillus piri TaxID=2547395 RepID=A0A4R5KDM8_9BACL|nr:hypothetical protein [Paenibacillus piri]TDF93459.1 hypothetical protein E1757_26350 [Paenibacillus piri]
MKIQFENKEIPVTFLSSDHKIIPRVLYALQARNRVERRNPLYDPEQLERIEVIGTEVYLYAKSGGDSSKVYLSLHG